MQKEELLGLIMQGMEDTYRNDKGRLVRRLLGMIVLCVVFGAALFIPGQPWPIRLFCLLFLTMPIVGIVFVIREMLDSDVKLVLKDQCLLDKTRKHERTIYWSDVANTQLKIRQSRFQRNAWLEFTMRSGDSITVEISDLHVLPEVLFDRVVLRATNGK